MDRTPRVRREEIGWHGFTLLEAMIVVAVMKILVGISASVLMTAANSWLLRSSAFGMTRVLQQGRIDAMKGSTLYRFLIAREAGNTPALFFADDAPTGQANGSDPQRSLATNMNPLFGTADSTMNLWACVLAERIMSISIC